MLEALAAARAGQLPGEAARGADARPRAGRVERDRREAGGIDDNPARLRIQTIDALCASLARQMPVLSRFGARRPRRRGRVGDSTARRRERAIGLVESGGAVAADVERLLAHLDNDVARVGALLAGMLARRDQWIRHVAGSATALDRARARSGARRTNAQRLVARAAALYPRRLARRDRTPGRRSRSRC